MTQQNDKKPVAGANSTTAPKPAPASAVPPGAVVEFLYLSTILDRRVRYEGDAKPFGTLHDIGASASTSYPQAICLAVAPRHGDPIVVPWSAVRSLSPRETVLSRTNGTAPTADFWARRDVLDDEVVDISGARVVRVNDVHLVYSGGKLVFGHVEVGVLGILRRLRFQRLAQFLMQWLFDYTIKETFVTWRHLEVLSPGGVPGGVRVSAAPERLVGMHPAELADVMEQMGEKDRRALFDSLPLDTAAEALEEVTPEFQRTLVSQQEPARAAEILEQMPPNEAADVLRDLGPDAQRIMSRMENGVAAGLKTILEGEEKSAGGALTASCIEARLDELAGGVLDRVRRMADEVDVFDYVYVLDGERHLLAVLTMRELLRAAPEATLESLMTRHVVTVHPDTPLTDVAKLFVKYAFGAIPVIDEARHFLGAVRFGSALSEFAPFLKE